jgi:hypothetical protein
MVISKKGVAKVGGVSAHPLSFTTPKTINKPMKAAYK